MLGHLSRIVDQFQGTVWAKDKESRYLYANALLLKTYNSTLDQALGKKDAELPAPASELGELFYQEDQRVLVTGATTHVLSCFSWQEYQRFSFLLVQKNVLRDEKNDVIGTFGIGMDVSHNTRLTNLLLHIDPHMIDAIKQQKQCSYSIENTYASINTTPREMECLFFMLRGNTAKKIASMLNLSPKTVESHIENIKHKARCSSREQLIEKCITEGLVNIIPRSLLGGISII